MSRFLLDTNVVSELTRDTPEPKVLAFLDRAPRPRLSAIVVHELQVGVQILPAGRRKDRLQAAVASLLNAFGDRILPVDRTAAEWAANIRADLIRSGRTPGLADMLIAGTAAVRNLAVVTRNVRDFEGLGIGVVNPWETAL
ncbi:MAG: type II toxin-antitoxin system VapC family toxin [bacterium]|nr:type II toxin-antitoxin system VapC family toxin [bacterium]